MHDMQWHKADYPAPAAGQTGWYLLMPIPYNRGL